ncbi:MAG: MCE family protein [Burkholderiales bacterium]|nr:MCE family protein [Burkholderiales bacterium]
MENKSHALITGCFTVLLLIATIWGAIWFNRDRAERIPYLLSTSQAISGLNPQAPVRFRGLMVGRVKTIAFDPEKRGQILVEIHVSPETPITHSTFATLGYQGVTGIAFVQLDDDGKQPQPLTSSASNMARLPLRPGLLAQLEQNAKQILGQSEELTRRANALLALSNQQKIFDTLDKFGKAADKFSTLPDQLQPTLARLPALAEKAQNSLQAVDTLAHDASKLANTLNQTAQNLQAKDGTLAKINQGVTQFTGLANEVEQETLPRIQALSEDARGTMRVFNKSLNTFNERPQSLIFGAAPIAPGPGETGFVAPSAGNPASPQP